MNIATQSAGRRGLYCQSENAKLRIGEMMDLIDGEIAKMKARAGSNRAVLNDLPLSMVAMMAYIDAFPCS